MEGCRALIPLAIVSPTTSVVKSWLRHCYGVTNLMWVKEGARRLTSYFGSHGLRSETIYLGH